MVSQFSIAILHSPLFCISTITRAEQAEESMVSASPAQPSPKRHARCSATHLAFPICTKKSEMMNSGYVRDTSDSGTLIPYPIICKRL